MILLLGVVKLLFKEAQVLSAKAHFCLAEAKIYLDPKTNALESLN
jgi:hypothetical protein